jgi:hypothetical protein
MDILKRKNGENIKHSINSTKANRMLVRFNNKIIRQLKSFHENIAKMFFRGSKLYWEQRYIHGGNSGAGSYGELAEFKAKIINNFIKLNRIQSAIEWGCGDGNQLSLINYPFYVGVDVSRKAIKLCEQKFRTDSTKKFYIYDDAIRLKVKQKYYLSLSLDVIFHLIEDNIFNDYMNNLFLSSKKFVVIYSSNSDELVDSAPHVKHRKFTNWIRDNQGKDWFLLKIIKNKYPMDRDNPLETSFSDFYIYQKNNS